ncbi:hypothetical protein RIR_jg27032.t1 [Rhizophagus irregularis DAOM 181602=DAOM 197198]|nr:hypothetical protein RIR_jg27032.t1 [Rhizophagus irregularis DAOM 181602=DAOM 197198]
MFAKTLKKFNVIPFPNSLVIIRGEVQSCAQKCLDRRTRRKKYDGILSFSRQNKLLGKISPMTVLYVQFNGANTEIIGQQICGQ